MQRHVTPLIASRISSSLPPSGWARMNSTAVISMAGVQSPYAYALMIPLMKDDDHGLTTGLYSLSRGVGTALGPLLAGIAIGIFDDGLFSGTDGYQAMWGVCGAAILLSVPILGRLRDETSQNR